MTPRTDELLLEINEGRTYVDVGPLTELARTLERENQELREALQACKDYDDEGTLPDKKLREKVEAILQKTGGTNV